MPDERTPADGLGGWPDDTIRRVQLPDDLLPSGVSAPALERPVEQMQTVDPSAFMPDGDGLHWYERLRVLGWKIDRDAKIVKVLYLVSQLIQLIKKGDLMSDKFKMLATTLLTGLLTVLASLHVLPGVTSDNATEIAGTIIGAGTALFGVYATIAHAKNADRANAAATTTNGLPPNLKP